MFRIAFDDWENQHWKTLELFESYDDADDAYDKWSEKMPYAWVEIQQQNADGRWYEV